MPVREEILEGTRAAARLQEKLDIRHRVESTRGSVDVFGAVASLGGTLLFRPLKGILGAYLPGANPGIVVTTERPLSIQRFTGAHELGHLFLKHNPSIDGNEILYLLGKTNPMEVQANAFGAEFLMPRWILALHARRRGWNRESMQDPVVVYQLSLRLGTSYEATCRSLKDHAIIDLATARRLLAIQPKAIKQKILPNLKPEDWFFDIWVLTSDDEGTVLEGQPKDLFLLTLNEKSGAGYLWNLDQLRAQGFVILRDTRVDAAGDEVGSPAVRQVTACNENPSKGQVSVALGRPWAASAAPAAEFTFSYDLLGKESGLPRAQRRLLEAVR